MGFLLKFLISQQLLIFKNDLYSAFPIKINALQKVLLPRSLIKFKFCTHSALSLLHGEHSGQSPFCRWAHANSTTITFAIYWDGLACPTSMSCLRPTWVLLGHPDDRALVNHILMRLSFKLLGKRAANGYFGLTNSKPLTHDCECIRASYNTNGI